MKFNFCLLGLLLSCCSVLAASERPGPVLDADLAGEYTGATNIHGMADGQGKAIGRDTYEGTFADGLPDGSGVYTWADATPTMANLQRVTFMVAARMLSVAATPMPASGRMAKFMAKGSSRGQTATSTKGNTVMTNAMATAPLPGQMVMLMRANGKMENDTAAAPL